MYERQVLLSDTIIRDLPRLRDTEAISRDTERLTYLIMNTCSYNVM
jgi:hypothetical protein